MNSFKENLGSNIFRLIFAALMLSCPAWLVAGPKPGQWAAGVMVGNDTGVTMKYWISKENAVDLDLGSYGFDSLAFNADYLWHRFNLFKSDRDDLANNMPLYFGVGGMAETMVGTLIPSNNSVTAGLRAVIGVTYLFPEPFDLFLEVAPTAIVTPNSGFLFQGSAGGRYYF